MNKSTVVSKTMNKNTEGPKSATVLNMINSPGIVSTKNIIIVVLVLLLILSFLGVNLLAMVGNILQFTVNLIRPLFDGILGWFFYYIGAAVNVSADVAGDVARTGIDIAEGTVHSVGNILQNRDNVGTSLPTQSVLYKTLFETTPVEEQETTYTVYSNNVQPIASDMGESIVNSMDRAESSVTKYVDESLDIAERLAADISEPVSINLGLSSMSSSPAERDLDKVIASEFKPNVSSVSPSASWCLVGQFGGKRSCMSLEENELCESGQTYSSQSDCMQLQIANANQVISQRAVVPNKTVVVKKTIVEKPAPVVYTQNWGVPVPIPPPAALSPPLGQVPMPIPPQNPYIPKTYGSYVSTPLQSTLQNPYYASNKYRTTPGTPNASYIGPMPGMYLQT